MGLYAGEQRNRHMVSLLCTSLMCDVPPERGERTELEAEVDAIKASLESYR